MEDGRLSKTPYPLSRVPSRAAPAPRPRSHPASQSHLAAVPFATGRGLPSLTRHCSHARIGKCVTELRRRVKWLETNLRTRIRLCGASEAHFGAPRASCWRGYQYNSRLAGTRQTRHDGCLHRNRSRNEGQSGCPMRSGWLETATTLEGGQRNDGILEDAGVSATRYAPFSRVRILALNGDSAPGAKSLEEMVRWF